MEQFFGNLKREWAGVRLYRTWQEAIADVLENMAMHYNSKWMHPTLDYKTPVEYEKDLNENVRNQLTTTYPLFGHKQALLPYLAR